MDEERKPPSDGDLDAAALAEFAIGDVMQHLLTPPYSDKPMRFMEFSARGEVPIPIRDSWDPNNITLPQWIPHTHMTTKEKPEIFPREFGAPGCGGLVFWLKPSFIGLTPQQMGYLTSSYLSKEQRDEIDNRIHHFCDALTNKYQLKSLADSEHDPTGIPYLHTRRCDS